MEKNYLLRYLILLTSALFASTTSYADRNGDFEFTVQIPYLYGEDVEFRGGAEASINSDPGFGFGLGYNYSDKLAGRINMNWNSTNYDVTRILDDGMQTKQRVTGELDAFSLGFAGDYYLTAGNIAPYIGAGMWKTDFGGDLGIVPIEIEDLG